MLTHRAWLKLIYGWRMVVQLGMRHLFLSCIFILLRCKSNVGNYDISCLFHITSLFFFLFTAKIIPVDIGFKPICYLFCVRFSCKIDVRNINIILLQKKSINTNVFNIHMGSFLWLVKLITIVTWLNLMWTESNRLEFEAHSK